MRKVDPVKHEAKRREILQAAERCFHRSGFRGASTAQICSEAKISPGHLFHYFQDKEAILMALADLRLEAAAADLEPILKSDGPIIEILIEKMANAGPKGPNSDGALMFEILAEAQRNPSIATMLRSTTRKVRQLLADVVRRGQAQGQFDRDLDPETAATVLIAIVDGAKAALLRDSANNAGKSALLLKTLVRRFLANDAAPSKQPAPGRRISRSKSQ